MNQQINNYGMWAFALCIFMEIGKLIGNVMNGYSPFYLFDLKFLFSLDNNFFILYWGGLIGIITNIFSDTGPQMPNFGSSLSENNSEAFDVKTNKSKRQKESQRDMAVRKERQFIKETVESRKAKQKNKIKDYMRERPQKLEDWVAKSESFKLFLKDNNLSYLEFESIGASYRASLFNNWLKAKEENLKNSNHNKTSKIKKYIDLSMFDFFRHQHYEEFEANQNIDLKTSKLEIIEIYKLYKAYLLLNHNIEVNDLHE